MDLYKSMMEFSPIMDLYKSMMEFYLGEYR